MKNKKLISFISGVCLIFTVMPLNVLAEGDSSGYEMTENENTVDTVNINDTLNETEMETLSISEYVIETDGDLYGATITWPATSGIKTYCKSTKNDTKVYQTATSTNGKYGTIYASDLVTIKGYDKNSKRYKVSYPLTGGGTKTGYVAASDITAATYNSANSTYTATAKTTTYRRTGGGTELGYISKGDKVYVLTSTSSTYVQVIYPVSGGYKMGWIKASALPGAPKATTAPKTSSINIGHARNSNLSNANQVSITPNSYFTDWTVVLRPTSTTIANKMVEVCKAGCANNNIRYSQGSRLTLNTAAKKVNYDLSKITSIVYCDCSSFMAVCAIGAGVNVSPSVTTSNMKNAFVATKKFDAITVKDASYLKKGDILLRAGSHTAMVLENGTNSGL
ncbi:MAG: hypothetical protein ACI4DP_06650 [Candidatus Ornithomonoglobus sp.]